MHTATDRRVITAAKMRFRLPFRSAGSSKLKSLY
jgi:hypothetical protein